MLYPKHYYANNKDYSTALLVHLANRYPQVDWNSIYNSLGLEELEKRVEIFEDNFAIFMN